MNVLKIIFSALLLGALLSGCQESTEATSTQPLTSTGKQPGNQQEIQHEQKQLSVAKPPEEQARINEPEQEQEQEPEPEPKVVVKAPEPVALQAPAKASQPLDVTLDTETVETIRMDVSDIMDRPMELPDLFGKYEKQVIIKSRVLVDKEGKALDKVDGAEINLEMKVP